MSHLNLSTTDTTDSDLEAIGKMKTLTMLDLDCTDITDQGLVHLASLNLYQLRLKDNPQLTDACIEHLSAIRTLELLHIENTAISINGLRTLLDKIQLESVILGSEFNDHVEELMQLSALHPQLEITFKGRGIIAKGKLNT